MNYYQFFKAVSLLAIACGIAVGLHCRKKNALKGHEHKLPFFKVYATAKSQVTATALLGRLMFLCHYPTALPQVFAFALSGLEYRQRYREISVYFRLHT